MMQTLEGTLDESGHVAFTEPLEIHGVRRVLVTLLDSANEGDMDSPLSSRKIAARGALKGKLSSVDEFIAGKAAEVALEEK